jgi:hypothetical protein
MKTSHVTYVLVIAGIVAFGVVGCETTPTKPTPPPPACTMTIAPSSQTFSSDGGAGSVTVTPSAASCAWTAALNVSWVTILEGASGTGPGMVKYNVAANSSTDARAGTITIGGQVHAVGQQGQVPVECTYAIDPTTASFGSEGGSGSFTVTAAASCSWNATSGTAWLKVTAGGQGLGNGTVSYTVDRNSTPDGRSAAIAVANKTLTVTQSGEAAPVVCEYSVAPVQFNPCMPAGTVATAITTQASCSWTVASNVSWLTLPNGGSGSGSGNISIAFSSNYDAPREGVVMVRWPTPTAGQNVRVSQAGCHYAVSKTSFSFAAAGGSGSFDVLQESDPNTCGGATQDACVWTATSDVAWITITTSMPRAGDNPVAFTVAPNATTASRSGHITVRDQVVTVTQAGS